MEAVEVHPSGIYLLHTTHSAAPLLITAPKVLDTNFDAC